ncbi:hypothetical protein EG327_006178 [Venturia inaequalis]|uniref:BTB domain-containing protein n=1 Tax=Venturia inaequalis TaxID=5025 RepID=A0A8H3VPW4_VENIN|nr:hypothetical protein EG327_006178 [Venturia inaequalis]
MANESPAADDSAATLKIGIARLLNSDKFSDLTITCRGKIFKAHKAVVCQQSRFFDNACKKNTFKVGQKRPYEESETGNVDLSYDDPAAVEAMYQYFYKCDYSELAKGSPNPMLLHVRIYCLACKYEVEALKSAAAKLFRATAETEDFDAQKLTPIIREIYDNTDDQDKLLRPEIVQIVVDSRFDIYKDASGDFAIMMMELGEFGKDVFFAMSAASAGPPDDTQFVCKTKGVYFNIDLGMVHKSFREDNQGATLKKGVASLLGSDKFSDMTITCKDNRVFKVHRAVICTQSEVFDKMCTKNWKEKNESNIDLTDQDTDAVEALLAYLYTSEYTAKEKENALVLHVHVYQLAHMYLIGELCKVAAELFDKAAEEDWNLPSFPLAVQETYANPEAEEKTLRKIVVKHAVDNLSELLEDDEGEFAKTMVVFGEFGKDVSRALIEESGSSYRSKKMKDYRCPDYSFHFRLDLRNVAAPYKESPKCPYCHVQHLAKMTSGDKTATIFYIHTCTTCDKRMESGSHKGSTYSLWCNSCNINRTFKLVGQRIE